MERVHSPWIMVSLLSEPAETWLGLVLLLIIVAVTARSAFCWRVDGRMDFLNALLRECLPDDLGEGSGDLPSVTPAEPGHRG